MDLKDLLKNIFKHKDDDYIDELVQKLDSFGIRTKEDVFNLTFPQLESLNLTGPTQRKFIDKVDEEFSGFKEKIHNDKSSYLDGNLKSIAEETKNLKDQNKTKKQNLKIGNAEVFRDRGMMYGDEDKSKREKDLLVTLVESKMEGAKVKRENYLEDLKKYQILIGGEKSGEKVEQPETNAQGTSTLFENSENDHSVDQKQFGGANAITSYVSDLFQKFSGKNAETEKSLTDQAAKIDKFEKTPENLSKKVDESENCFEIKLTELNQKFNTLSDMVAKLDNGLEKIRSKNKQEFNASLDNKIIQEFNHLKTQLEIVNRTSIHSKFNSILEDVKEIHRNQFESIADLNNKIEKIIHEQNSLKKENEFLKEKNELLEERLNKIENQQGYAGKPNQFSGEWKRTEDSNGQRNKVIQLHPDTGGCTKTNSDKSHEAYSYEQSTSRY